MDRMSFTLTDRWVVRTHHLMGKSKQTDRDIDQPKALLKHVTLGCHSLDRPSQRREDELNRAIVMCQYAGPFACCDCPLGVLMALKLLGEHRGPNGHNRTDRNTINSLCKAEQIVAVDVVEASDCLVAYPRKGIGRALCNRRTWKGSCTLRRYVPD